MSKIQSDQNEPSISTTLNKFALIYSRLSFIKELSRISQYSDEPKYFQYVVRMEDDPKLTDGHISKDKKAGGGSFISEDMALLKCLAEAVERYSCSTYQNSDLITSSYSRLKNAVDISKIQALSGQQKKRNANFSVTKNSVIRWKQGISLKTGSMVYIPAQQIYHNYRFRTGERAFYLPISTGAAGGGNLDSALLRGIFEIVERDAFMIAYLNKIRFPKIRLESIPDKQIQTIVGTIRKYRLEIHLIDLTNDLKIPTYLSIIVNKTGVGPAVSVGLKTHLLPLNAIIGSMEEAFNVRTWIRQYFEDNPNKRLRIKPGGINTTEERGLYWYPKKRVEYLDFWINQEEKDIDLDSPTTSQKQTLAYALSLLDEKGYEAFFADLTLPILAEIGYRVVKVVIPGLQPFFMNESLPYLGGDRLKDVPRSLCYKFSRTLNTVPHPFL